MAATKFHPGQKVRCIHAPEPGIPLTEGEVYTVRDSGRPGRFTEVDFPERRHTIAVLLEEVQGIFMETRFEAVTDAA